MSEILKLVLSSKSARANTEIAAANLAVDGFIPWVS